MMRCSFLGLMDCVCELVALYVVPLPRTSCTFCIHYYVRSANINSHPFAACTWQHLPQLVVELLGVC